MKRIADYLTYGVYLAVRGVFMLTTAFQRESLRAADTLMSYDTVARGGRSTRTVAHSKSLARRRRRLNAL